MGYRTPAQRAAAVKQAKNALLAARRAVLTTHLNADGDGAGSEGAIASWLRANGTEAWIINPTTFPDSLSFLLENPDWCVPAGSNRARELCEQADVAVVLDTGELQRIGRVQEAIRELPTVVIDHHPPGDQPGSRCGTSRPRRPRSSSTTSSAPPTALGATGWRRASMSGS